MALAERTLRTVLLSPMRSFSGLAGTTWYGTVSGETCKQALRRDGYRFRVAACNNSGVWNEAGTFLDFSIAPAYYQTNWFRGLCAATFLALLWALYRRRIQQVKRQEKQLRDVIDTIPALAFSSSPDGKNEWVNRRWVEYSGLSQESSSGSGWRSTVHPDDLDEHVKSGRDPWQAVSRSKMRRGAGAPMMNTAGF